ncbi:hypothetical protein E2C01_060836 [Portunus trituberculatus]|uniref:Uncharacterized protein n=1 Tax=Portunus trituberculatus TaxID=210409 RepID=A0A5B7HAJ7_PORTR|nr:hypothetical protein [Portunus trituberculatus]
MVTAFSDYGGDLAEVTEIRQIDIKSDVACAGVWNGFMFPVRTTGEKLTLQHTPGSCSVLSVAVTHPAGEIFIFSYI